MAYPRSLPRRRQQVIDGAKQTTRETESGAPGRHVHNHVWHNLLSTKNREPWAFGFPSTKGWEEPGW
jgi:hypothetical protein